MFVGIILGCKGTNILSNYQASLHKNFHYAIFVHVYVVSAYGLIYIIRYKKISAQETRTAPSADFPRLAMDNATLLGMGDAN